MSELANRPIQRSSDHSCRSRDILEGARVSIWDKDYSGVLDFLTEIRGEGVQDLRAYLHDGPGRLSEALRRVRINDVNAYSVELFEAQSKNELLNSFALIFVPETYEVFTDATSRYGKEITMSKARPLFKRSKAPGARLLSPLLLERGFANTRS